MQEFLLGNLKTEKTEFSDCPFYGHSILNPLTWEPYLENNLGNGLYGICYPSKTFTFESLSPITQDIDFTFSGAVSLTNKNIVKMKGFVRIYTSGGNNMFYQLPGNTPQNIIMGLRLSSDNTFQFDRFPIGHPFITWRAEWIGTYNADAWCYVIYAKKEEP